MGGRRATPKTILIAFRANRALDGVLGVVVFPISIRTVSGACMKNFVITFFGAVKEKLVAVSVLVALRAVLSILVTVQTRCLTQRALVLSIIGVLPVPVLAVFDTRLLIFPIAVLLGPEILLLAAHRIHAALCAVGGLGLAAHTVSVTRAADRVPVLDLLPVAMWAIDHTVILGPTEDLLGDPKFD